MSNGPRPEVDLPHDDRREGASGDHVPPGPEPPAPDPLDGLVDGVRRGDRDAVAAVYLAVAPTLRGYLRRRVPHGEVADDLVEQAFLELLRHGGTIVGDGRSLRAWLYRTARNDLTDWRRSAARREDHQLPDRGGLADPAEADPADLAVDASPDPALERALASLTDDQREVVELRFVAQLSVAATAAVLGRSQGAVKQLQHRALRRLAELLGPEHL